MMPRERRYGTAWKKTRERILRERGFQCEHCGGGSLLQLTVHHVTYERFGNELDEDLLVLCRRCHVAEHNRIRDEWYRENTGWPNDWPTAQDYIDSGMEVPEGIA